MHGNRHIGAEFVAACVVALVATAGCRSPQDASFGSLRVGLTEPEVRDLLGEPTVVVPARIGEDGTPLRGPRWQYGDTLSTVTTAATFPDTIPDRVWVVWFDVDGRVLTWRPPVVEDDPASGGAARDRTPLFADPAPPRNR